MKDQDARNADYSGVTPSERHLHALSRKTFLSLWSLPNLYRDQGKALGREGKEIADLVVAFGEDLLIFSDKSCAFSNTASTEVAWGRWYRRAVLNSIHQLYGAKDWVLRHPDRVFRDRACTKKVDLPLLTKSFRRVHLVAVASGASEACRQFFGGGSGCLIVAPESERTGQDTPPLFTFDDAYPEKHFVHVFDDVSLALIMHERDTIADFIDYLVAREELIRSRSLGIAAGEDDLLGWYLMSYEPGIGRRFKVQPGTTLAVLEGHYADLVNREEYQRGKRADRVSYLVDEVIEKFTHHLQVGDLLLEPASAPSETEIILRALASERRVARRVLGATWLNQALTTERGQLRRGVIVSQDRPTRAYATIMMHRDDHPVDEYRERRRAVLRAYCITVADEFPNVNEVIGVATEAQDEAGSSYDLIYLDLTERPEGLHEEAEFFRKTLGFFGKKTRWNEFTTAEYPVAQQLTLQRPKTAVAERSMITRKEHRRRRKAERQRRRRGG